MCKRALIELKKVPRQYIAYARSQVALVLDKDNSRYGLSAFYRDHKRSDDYTAITFSGLKRLYFGVIGEILRYYLRLNYFMLFQYMYELPIYGVILLQSLSPFFDCY